MNRRQIYPAGGGVLLRKAEVCRRLGDISHDTLERMVAAGEFPRPVRVGRLPKWTDGDVEAYIAARDARRRAPGL